MNESTKKQIAEEFAYGWRVWCSFGDDDGLTSHGVAGYYEAAECNELGGDRPECADAEEAAAEYVKGI